jgi:hypothetical protein
MAPVSVRNQVCVTPRYNKAHPAPLDPILTFHGTGIVGAVRRRHNLTARAHVQRLVYIQVAVETIQLLARRTPAAADDVSCRCSWRHTCSGNSASLSTPARSASPEHDACITTGGPGPRQQATAGMAGHELVPACCTTAVALCCLFADILEQPQQADHVNLLLGWLACQEIYGTGWHSATFGAHMRLGCTDGDNTPGQAERRLRAAPRQRRAPGTGDGTSAPDAVTTPASARRHGRRLAALTHGSCNEMRPLQ